MSVVLTKFVLTLALFGAALVALWTMLTLMGREERSLTPGKLRTTHRVFGYAAFALTVVVGVMGYRLSAAAGGAITHRAVLHSTVAALFFVVFLFKVVIARHYRQFLKYMPALGLIAFALLFAVVSVTAGYRIARGIWKTPASEESVAWELGAESALALSETGDAESGRRIFVADCSGCHAHEGSEFLVGPSLAGLVAQEAEKEGSREDAFEEILEQVLHPSGTMPSFEGVLGRDELADLMAYLDTL
jgi:mono/diheme cytochrome c family protein